MENKETIKKLFKEMNTVIYEYANTDEVKRLAKKEISIQEKLYKTLTKEQIQQIEAYNAVEGERAYETNMNVFTYGFSLATQLYAEGLQK